MAEICSSLRRMTWLSAIVFLAAIVLNASAASAQPALGKASGFAALGGPAVTCTDSGAPNTITDVTGDVGVVLATGFTNNGCTILGTVYQGGPVARAAYIDFLIAYNNLQTKPPACDSTHLTSTLAGVLLLPGVYCLNETAKTGTLTLDAQGHANAVWIFLVADSAVAPTGALTGTNFNVVMINGGQPCNVYWWVEAAATMTTSNFLGTILAGAAITVTGGTFDGHALATDAVTLKDTKVTACEATGAGDDDGQGDHDGDHDGHHGDKDHDGHHGDKDHKDHDSKDKDGKDHGSKDKK